MKVITETQLVYSAYDIIKMALVLHEDKYAQFEEKDYYPSNFNKVIRIDLGRAAGHTTASLRLLQENKRSVIYNPVLPRRPVPKRIVTVNSMAIALSFNPELVIIDPSEGFNLEIIDTIINAHQYTAKQILILG